MPRSMTEDEIRAFLDGKPGWIALSTLGADGFPHTVPLGYYRLGSDVLMGVRDRTTKVRNVERDPRVTLMLESGTTMSDLRGVMLKGIAHLHREPREVLHYMREGARQRGVSDQELPTEARSGAVYIRVAPSAVISWRYG